MVFLYQRMMLRRNVRAARYIPKRLRQLYTFVQDYTSTDDIKYFNFSILTIDLTVLDPDELSYCTNNPVTGARVCPSSNKKSSSSSVFDCGAFLHKRRSLLSDIQFTNAMTRQ